MNPSARVSFCACALLHPLFAVSSIGFLWGSLRRQSCFLVLLSFHGLSKLVLDFLLQEGVDECFQSHVRGWLLVKDDVVVVHVPDAFELGASLNLSRE